jgi:hypothetical protein
MLPLRGSSREAGEGVSSPDNRLAHTDGCARPHITVDMMFLVCSGVVVDLDPLPMHERHAFGLQRLAEMSGTLVEQAYRRAIVAEGSEAKDSAALVFDRLARGYRLTLALEARFARDIRREARESADGVAPAAPSLPRPVGAPRPERPAREPTESDHESEMEVEDVSDALAIRVKDLSHILEDQADLLDPDGSERANLDRIAAWWAEGQRYEPGYQAPKPQSPKAKGRKAKARRTRPPRPKDFHSRDTQARDIPDEDIPDDEIYGEIDDDFDSDDFDDDQLWLESG